MARDYFPCYHSYFKKCEKLTDQELGRLFRALLKYSTTGERQELAGRESIAFDFIADDIDRAKDNYADQCEKNRKNIQKRYNNEPTTEYDRIRPNTNVYETYQSESESENKDEYKSDNKKENAKRKSAAFSPPTLEEVKAYCRERNSNVDAKHFYDYFSTPNDKGETWIDSKGQKVKNWKQKLLTWEKMNPTPKKAIAEESDYASDFDTDDVLAFYESMK